MSSEAGSPSATQVLEKGAVSVEDAKFSESSPVRGRLDRLREMARDRATVITDGVRGVMGKAPKDVQGSLKGDSLELHVLNNTLTTLGESAAIGLGQNRIETPIEPEDTRKDAASAAPDSKEDIKTLGVEPVIQETEPEPVDHADAPRVVEDRPQEPDRAVAKEGPSADQAKEIEGRGGNKVEELLEAEFSDPSLWGKKREAAGIFGLEHPRDKYGIQNDSEWVIDDPSSIWSANIYGMRVVPDEAAVTAGAVKLEAVDLKMLPAIHQRLAETVLKDENIRIATPTVPPNADGGVLDPVNNNYWLQMIVDHKWPIYAEDTRAGEPPYSSHDYADYHLPNFVLFPREIQDIITDAATYDLEWRQLRQNGEVSTEMKLIGMESENSKDPWASGFRGGTSLTDGISKIDDISDAQTYIPLLVFAVSNPGSPEASIAELLAYEKEPERIAGDPRNQVVAGLNRMRAVVGDIVNFNTRYREDRNITQEEADQAFNDFLTGTARVAHKIRGDFVGES